MGFFVRSLWRMTRVGYSHTVSLQSRSISIATHFHAYPTGYTGTQTALSKPEDPILSSLISASSSSELFTTLQSQQPSLGPKHLVQALRTLFELHKRDLIEKDIIKDPAFEVLCQNIKKHSKTLDINEIIEVTKVASYLGVSESSLIVQTMLQLIRAQINELNIRQIMFIDFILSKFDAKNHLVDALKLALPLVFQIHLPLELDREDLPLLKDMLSYSCYHDLPNKCVNNVVTALLMTEQGFDAQTAKSIVWALCQVNCTKQVFPTRAKLLHTSFDVLTVKMLELPYGDVLWTVAKLKGRIIEKQPEFYHERMMDAVGDFLVTRNVPFEKSLLIARIFSRIAHSHLGLMEHLCNLALEDVTYLARAPTNMLLGFINCLSNTNYTPYPKTWNALRAQISENPLMSSKNLALPWSKFCLELVTLGHYEDRLIQKVFSKEFLDQFLSKSSSTLDYIQLLMLHEAVQTFHNGRFSLPREVQAAGRASYPVHTITESIAESLATGLSSPEHLVTNVMLPNGFVADILMCIHEGQPIPLPQLPKPKMGKVPLSKLNLPADSVAVCIMCFTQNCYSLNSSRLRGTFQLLMNILERQGYLTVPINVSHWLNTPQHEKTLAVMREVRYKCQQIGVDVAVHSG